MQATERKASGAAPGSSIEKLGQPDGSQIKQVIAVVSGKVGSASSLSALLAVSLAREGHRWGCDADIPARVSEARPAKPATLRKW